MTEPRVQKSSLWIRFKAFLIWLIASLILATVRIVTKGAANLEKARAGGKPILYAFWHGRQLALFKVNPESNLTVLTSLSKDGQMQAHICRRFGVHVVRGSSSRGGLAGLIALGRAVQSGFPIGMAVDGPRGPAFAAKPGIVALARRTGSPIVPITVGFGSRKQLSGAWDKFQIPLPFTRATVAYGKPLVVPPGATTEEMNRIAEQLGERLRELTLGVDADDPKG
jgi:lysophospholipid acyltransferase (LPLAT)-like uncharacterized protein